MQTFDGSVKEYLLKTVLGSVIYFKLSIFQRHHAQERVFDKRRIIKKLKASSRRVEVNVETA